MSARRVLALASGGGHWMQLMRLRPAFEGHRVLWVTTLAGLPEQAGLDRHALVPECNRNTPLRVIACAVRLLVLMLRERPQTVVTTGALPGYVALRIGRLLGARTVWIDSVANAEEMSLAGRKARAHADLCLSQWRHVAEAEGVEHAGSVL